MQLASGPVYARAVIAACGTFLNGLMHIGMKSFEGGRMEDKKASRALPESLKQLGFTLLRFKTGTCARIKAKTINFSRMKTQQGDADPRAFSFSTNKLDIKQIPCSSVGKWKS